jgi:YbbR domain-containing protein
VADSPPTLPPDAETRRSRRRALTKSFAARATENLWIKVTALGLAILMWYVITQREPTSTFVPVRLHLELDSSLALRAPPMDVTAIVQGTPAELSRLEGRTATITRSINANTPDTLIITLNRTDVVLPANVDARVTDILPKTVRLEFVRPVTKRVPVRSQVLVIGGDTLNPPFIEILPERVEIVGPRQAITQIAFVRTDTTSILASDSIPHQVAIDTAGLGVTVKPNQVSLRLLRRRPP